MPFTLVVPECLRLWRYVPCLNPAVHAGSTPIEVAETTDIRFACPHCATRYVVTVAAAGAIMHCQNCGNTAAVPSPGFVSSAENTVRTSELHHQLKENESQRTEVTSYINQLNIQLHRWQLRLKDLNERQKKLQAELATVSGTAAR